MRHPRKWCGIIIIILIGAILLSFSTQKTKRSDKTNQIDLNSWILEWEEDFTSSSIDTSVWRYMERKKQGSWKYHSPHPQNYDLQNGILTLKGFKNNGSVPDTATYITGGIYTKGKKSFSPGRFEIRAKIIAHDIFK